MTTEHLQDSPENNGVAMQSGYVVYGSDSVGTALEDLRPGEIRVLGISGAADVCATEDIPKGHKFALKDICKGAAVYKYGARIGTATENILKGSHVHLHNMKSDFDERASTLDVQTAAPTDVEYRIYTKE